MEGDFDSRQQHPKRHRESHRHQRPKRASHREERLRPVPEWNYVMEATSPSPGGEERKKKSRCCKRIRLYISLLFLVGYFLLVALLVSMMLSERKLLEAPGADTPECQKKICPIESPCQIQDHEAKCVFVSLANLQALEVLLGVVVCVPLAICIPCTLHWFFRKVRGKSWGPRKPTRSTTSRTSYPSGTVLGRQEEVEKGDSEDSNRALTEVKGEEEVCGYQPRVEEDLDLDDGLDDLFTPLAKTVEEEIAQEEAENELDLLFTPKPKVKKASPAKTDHPKPELKVPSSVGGESEFSALFHKRLGASKHGPSRRSQEEAAMSDLHSNFSEGMSVLFASLKYLQAQKSKAPHSSPQVDASIISGNHMSTVESNVDWLDLDLGDPPDFFHFALRIASTSGQHLEALGPTMGPRRPSEDSLADMEPDELEELFHPPLR